jgi:uncharacterized glyoxalase superfamily protein PhnB
MLTNRSIPAVTVIPEIPYPDVEAAIDWLTRAFGFTLRIQMGNHRAQLNVGSDGAVVLTDRWPGKCSLLVRVEDVYAHHERALRHGATILRPPADYPYGERQYTVSDHAGHAWSFSQSIADVSPEEWGGTTGTL